MIKKLSQKIFGLIMVSLGTIILGIILLFAFFSYNNTINTATMMMDRIVGMPKKGPEEKGEPGKLKPETNIEGVYYIYIENGNIVPNDNGSNNQTINEYALKIAQKNSKKGMIGKYIYQTRKLQGNKVTVILMENENAISHIKVIIIFSIIVSIFSLVVIWILAKKISQNIVKPVEETFEKQKQFISDASHELKTPLAVIEANADVLADEIGNNKWMEYIQNEVDSMDKLINELLLLAKVENIDNLKEDTNFNLSKEVEIVLAMFESMAYEKQVRIKTNIQENVMMNGSKADIEHIVSILVDNAIKHTKANDEIIVELSKEKNEKILQVKNMGEPIPEEEREKIFERFYRIDKSRNRKEKRYGLGLAIAKSIVKKYNGKIEVACKENFTVFQVSIP